MGFEIDGAAAVNEIFLVMEASFQERDKQILDRLVGVFGRVPNGMNVRLPELISPRFTINSFIQWKESKMPGRLDDCCLLYLTKHANSSIDRQTTSKEKKTGIGNQQFENLTIVSVIPIAGRVFSASENTSLCAIRFTMQS